MTESSSSSSLRVPTSAFASLGWAVYLACSWTWCIGMFLPVLLVRDFGLAGWIVFAVPNVIGAAAFGFFVRDGEMSRRIVANHRPAIEFFSAVTIAYQIMFIGGFLPWIAGKWIVLLPVVAMIFWSQLDPEKRREIRSAAVALIVSLLAMAIFTLKKGPAEIELWHHSKSALWIAPVCAFGFLLCPYLDATFHHARQNTSVIGGRIAFAVGFGIFFFAMIVFSLAYALRSSSLLPVFSQLTATLIGIHMIVQLAFTISAHARAIQQSGGMIAHIVGSPAVVVAMVSIFILLGMVSGSSSENIYLIFLSFYGLIFPAYVWLCMIPAQGGIWANGGRKILIFLLTILVASPMYWMGFIEKRYWWLVPGVVVVLASRFLIFSPLKWPRRAGEIAEKASIESAAV